MPLARSTTTASSSRRPRPSPTASGPTYNAQSCRECHQNVVTGGASQVAEHRTGRLEDGAVLRIAGRLADPFARHASRASWSSWPSRTTSGPSGSRPTRSAPASSRPSPTARCSRSATPACSDARHRHHGARARSQQRRARRPFRLEEPARQPRVVRGRRLPERDGHHDAALPGGEHVERPRRRPALRHGRRSRRRRRRRRGVCRLHARDQGAAARTDHADVRGRRAALHAGRLRRLPRRRRSPRRGRARRSTAAR